MVITIAEEELGGIVDRRESGLRHAKDADLVDRSESVLRRAEHAMIERALALEIEHGVNDVLEGLRAGDAAAFGDVPDDEYGRAAFLGEAHETRRAFAHLPHVARRAFEIRREHRLDGIDYERRGTDRRRGGEDGLEIGLAEERDVVGVLAQAVGTQLHLEGGFLTRRVQRGMARALEPRGDVQQERGFADPRFAADEDHRARNDASTQHKIELAKAGLPPPRLRALDVAEAWRSGDCPSCGERLGTADPSRSRVRGLGGTHLFDERVPFTARIATAGPFRVVGTAFRAAIGCFCLHERL